jgi:ribosomal protein S3AE
MKEFKDMTLDELEEELKLSRELVSTIQKELDRLISFAIDIKAKISNNQVPVHKVPWKSIRQKIVELIHENDNKFTSNDICNYFVQQKIYSDIESSRKTIHPILSLLRSKGYINNVKGKPWFFVKKYDKKLIGN